MNVFSGLAYSFTVTRSLEQAVEAIKLYTQTV